MKLMKTLVLLLPVTAFAAPPVPVHFQATGPAKAVKAGAKFDVVVRATIDPGWHLYTLTEPEDGPIATEINLTEGDAAELLGAVQSTPRTTQDPVFAKPVTLFEKSAVFTLHLRVGRSVTAGVHPLHVLVRYQSCNDHVCLPPHTETVVVEMSTN